MSYPCDRVPASPKHSAQGPAASIRAPGGRCSATLRCVRSPAKAGIARSTRRAETNRDSMHAHACASQERACPRTGCAQTKTLFFSRAAPDASPVVNIGCAPGNGAGEVRRCLGARAPLRLTGLHLHRGTASARAASGRARRSDAGGVSRASGQHCGEGGEVRRMELLGQTSDFFWTGDSRGQSLMTRNSPSETPSHGPRTLPHHRVATPCADRRWSPLYGPAFARLDLRLLPATSLGVQYPRSAAD